MRNESKTEVARGKLIKENGVEITVIYYVITDTIPDCYTGSELYSYGVRVSVPGPEGAEEARFRGITLSGDRIYKLAGFLARNKVTPCAARDVIEDWLLDM